MRGIASITNYQFEKIAFVPNIQKNILNTDTIEAELNYQSEKVMWRQKSFLFMDWEFHLENIRKRGRGNAH
jgi:hypothetical protein